MSTFTSSQRLDKNQRVVSSTSTRRLKIPPSKTGTAQEDSALISNHSMMHLLMAQVIKAKLNISNPNDEDERQADRIADEIMHMPNPDVLEEDIGTIEGRSTDVRRKTTSHEECGEIDIENQNEHIGVTELDILRNNGERLPSSVLNYFEPRFGYGFSKVKVHTGEQAGSFAKMIDARAFTFQNNIVFDQNEYSPQTYSGRKLLAHELTHIVQSRSSLIPKLNSGYLNKIATKNRLYSGVLSNERKNDISINSDGLSGNMSSTPKIHRVKKTKNKTSSKPQLVGILDGKNIRTYSDIVSFMGTQNKLLSAKSKIIISEGGFLPPVLLKTKKDGVFISSLAQTQGGKQVSDAFYNEVYKWYSSVESAISAGELVRAWIAKKNLGKLKFQAKQAKQKLIYIDQKIANKKRDAFNSEGVNKEFLSLLWEWSTKVTGVMGDVTELIKACDDAADSILPAIHRGKWGVAKSGGVFKLPSVKVLAPLLSIVTKVIGGAEGLMAISSMSQGGKSGFQETKAAISGSYKIAAIVGSTVVSAPLIVTAPLNYYLSSAIDSSLKSLSGIEDVSRMINKDLIEIGRYDKVNWSLEPGGRRLFDFMLAVMAALSPSGVPSPIPKFIANYLVQYRSEIEAGVSGGKEGKELPTTGFWIFKSVDKNRIANWVFYYRVNLWSVFYGSAKPGANA